MLDFDINIRHPVPLHVGLALGLPCQDSASQVQVTVAGIDTVVGLNQVYWQPHLGAVSLKSSQINVQDHLQDQY